MALATILAGLGIVLGASGHAEAQETNEKAQKIAKKAQEIYDTSKEKLEKEKIKTQRALLKLGYTKKHTLDTSLKQFMQYYPKIKAVQWRESVGFDELADFNIDMQDLVELKELEDIYSEAFETSAVGAVTGAAITVAAGSALTAATLSAAVTPLSMIAAPAVLFSAISASLKADENLENAMKMCAEAEAASEEMETSRTICIAITKRSEMFNDLLTELNGMFSQCSDQLAGIIKSKEGFIFKKKITSKDFSNDEIKLIATTAALAKAVKSVIDTPMLSNDGSKVSYESRELYEKLENSVPLLTSKAKDAMNTKYNAAPVLSESKMEELGLEDLIPWGGIRGIGSFIAGVIAALILSNIIVKFIPTAGQKFLFLKASTVDKFALWLIVCGMVTMLLGECRETKMEIACKVGAGVGMLLMYIQYCQTVGNMKHYIIVSVLVLILFNVMYFALNKKKDLWEFADFFCYVLMYAASYPILFLLYALCSKAIGIPSIICLIVTTLLMALMILGNLLEYIDLEELG